MKEYFDRLPVGEVVNKRGLAYLKRLGLIWDYSKWGYLEGLRMRGTDDDWYNIDRDLFPNGNAKEAEQLEGAMYEKWRQGQGRSDELTHDELREKFPNGRIEALGNEFDTKYFDGCFMPYLVKTGPESGKQVNHRMCLWGAII